MPQSVSDVTPKSPLSTGKIKRKFLKIFILDSATTDIFDSYISIFQGGIKLTLVLGVAIRVFVVISEVN